MINVLWGWVVGYTFAVVIQASYAVYLMRHDIFSVVNNIASRVAVFVHQFG
jgi:hypothetical protein